MTYNVLGLGALDYLPCRYGTSKLVFRGPKRALRDPYVAFLGGTQTFGKFIEQPYPLRVEHLTGVTSVNFGQLNAGPDVFAADLVVHEAARKARVSVVEAMGAGNMSNRLYSVHKRRNDRFLRASEELRNLYPEVDFTQFNFTQHMLCDLYERDRNRFAVLRSSLQRVWIRRMRHLMGHLGAKVVLVRIGSNTLAQNAPCETGYGPVLVSDAMLDSVASSACAVVDVPISRASAARTNEGMAFNPLEEDAAGAVAPPQVHAAVARSLLPVLDRLM